jgi:hypothetical protein
MDGFQALDLPSDEALASLVRNGPHREPDYLDDLPEQESPSNEFALTELPLQIYWLMCAAAASSFGSGLLTNVTYDLLKAGLKKVRANAKPPKWRPRSHLREEAENFDRVCKDYARAAVIARCEQVGLRPPSPRDLRVESWTNVAEGPWTLELKARVTSSRDPSFEAQVRFNPVHIQTTGAEVTIRQARDPDKNP